MREMSVNNYQLSRADHPRPERFHQPMGEESAMCSELSETIAEFTLQAGGRKIKVAMLVHGGVTSHVEACSPAQLCPDQWAKLCDVLLMAAHSIISMDYPEDDD